MTLEMLETIVPLYDEELARISRIARAGFVIAMAYEISGPEYIANYYPEEWQKHYSENALLTVDPIAHWILVTQDGFERWSNIYDLYAGNSRLANFKARAGHYGLKYGFVGVVQTPASKRRSFISAARSDRELTDAEMQGIYSTFRSWVAIYDNSRPELTDEHIAVLRLLAAGLEIDEIATKLGISKSAVKQRNTRIYNILNVPNRAAAVSVATARRLL